jgi:hypothetical protein
MARKNVTRLTSLPHGAGCACKLPLPPSATLMTTLAAASRRVLSGKRV